MQTIVRLQAICLVLILTLGSVAAPASAQANDPKQPSEDNPMMGSTNSILNRNI
jgi:hypothetical protein